MRNYKILLVLTGFLLGSLNAFGVDLSTTTSLNGGSSDFDSDRKVLTLFHVKASFKGKTSLIDGPHSLRVLIKPVTNLSFVKPISRIIKDGGSARIDNLAMNIGQYDVTFYVLKSNGRVLAHKKVRISLAMEGISKIVWKVRHLSGNLIPNGYQPIINVSNNREWSLRVQPR